MTLRAYRFVSAADAACSGWLSYRAKRGKENPERVIERHGETDAGAPRRPAGLAAWRKRRRTDSRSCR